MTMNPHTKLNKIFSRGVLASLLLASTLSVGCAEEFDPPSLIDKARPLGAEVQVEGDPSRSTPRPGETAKVTWLMAAPAEMPTLAWMFAICRSGTATPAEGCAPAPYASFEGAGSPSFRFTVPSQEILGDATRLLIIGQVCTSGAPTLDPQSGLPACPGEGNTVTATLFLQQADAGNQIPALSERSFWFDGADWLADGPEVDCAGLPSVALGSKDHVLGLRTLAEDRETYVTGDTTAREELQLSQFTTAGKLGQTYLVVEPSNQEPSNDLESKWDAPETMTADGRVYFIFVARDLRGGVSHITRTVCVY
jgi:hypothetical protein